MSNDFLEAYRIREEQVEEDLKQQDRLMQMGKQQEKKNIARRLIDNGLEPKKASDYTGIDIKDIPPSVIETKPNYEDYSNLTKGYIDEVWDMLNRPNLEADVERQYELKQKYIRDTLTNISGAWNEGKEQANLEIAQKLLEMNMNEQEILAVTDTSKDEVNLHREKEEREKQGRELGERRKALEIAKKLLKKGMEKDEVSDVTGLPLSDLEFD